MVQELNKYMITLSFTEEELPVRQSTDINEATSLIINELMNNDMYLISDYWESLGNSAATLDFYNVRTDVVFSLVSTQLSDFLLGESDVIEMYGSEPDEYDRERIEQFFGE